MSKQLLGYLKKILGSLLLVIYILILLDKIGWGIKTLNVKVLATIALLPTIVFIFLKLGDYWRKILSIKNSLKVQAASLFRKTDLLLPVQLSIVVLLAISIFAIFDIFSTSQAGDFTILALTGIFVLASIICGLDGKITIVEGLLFLVLCPFLIVYKREPSAEKAAIWAFMFFVGGVIQEFLFQKREVKYSRNISLLSSGFKRGYDSLVGKIAHLQSDQPGLSVISKEEEKRRVSLSSLLPSRESSPSFLRRILFASEVTISQVSTTGMFKTKHDGEFLKKIFLIDKLATKIFDNLSEKDKIFFGARYIRLIKSIETDIYEIYKFVGNKDKFSAQCYKIKSSLYELLFLTLMMDKYKMVSSELLDRLVKLLNEETLKLDSSV